MPTSARGDTKRPASEAPASFLPTAPCPPPPCSSALFFLLLVGCCRAALCQALSSGVSQALGQAQVAQALQGLVVAGAAPDTEGPCQIYF
eukprot:1326582-Rhodomonas_salina.1